MSSRATAPSGTSAAKPSRDHFGGAVLVTAFLAWLGMQVAAAVVAAVGASIFGVPASKLSSMQQLAVFVPVWAAWIAIAVFAARRVGVTINFSLRPADVGAGLAAGLALQWVVFGVYWLAERVVGSLDVDGPGRRMVELAKTNPDKWALAVIVGIGAPIAEETVYRGFIQPALVRVAGGPASARSAAIGVGVTAVWFAAAHVQSVQFIGLAIVGVVLGVLAHRSGRLGPSIVAHATFNLLSLGALLGIWVPFPH